jgi:hypothetical protein
VGSAILVPTLFAKYPCFLNDTFSSTLNPNNGTIGNLIVTSALTEMTLPNGVLDTAFVVGQEFRDASGTLLSQQQINAFFLKGDFAGVQDLNYWVPGVGLVKEEIFDCSKNGVKFMSMRRTLQSWKLN